MAGSALGEAMGIIGRRLRRLLVACGLLALVIYATVGFVRQERTVRQLAGDVAIRQQERDDALREQQILTTELAALNDPARYGNYANLVARHTLMLARPNETLVIVTWKSEGGAPAASRATDWNALLHAAGIRTP